MSEFLVEQSDSRSYQHNPYTADGAKHIIRRGRDTVKETLLTLEASPGFELPLAKSPCRSRVYVAAALKTAGWIGESASETGACILYLTDKGLDQVSYMRSQGWDKEQRYSA